MIKSMTVRADELQEGDVAVLAGVVVKIRQPELSPTGRTVVVTWPPQGMVESGRVTLSPAEPVVIEREAMGTLSLPDVLPSPEELLARSATIDDPHAAFHVRSMLPTPSPLCTGCTTQEA